MIGLFQKRHDHDRFREGGDESIAALTIGGYCSDILIIKSLKEVSRQ